MQTKIKMLKALGDETRLKILEYLKKGEQCACTIVPYTGRSQPNVSLHLKKLEKAGILCSRKEGTRILYKIKNRSFLKILELLK